MLTNRSILASCRYASRTEFPNDYYNDYCSAAAVIIPSQLISNMFEASKNAPYYKVSRRNLSELRKLELAFTSNFSKCFLD